MATIEEIDVYVQTQLALGDVKTKNATSNRVSKVKYPQRSTILKLLQAVRGFQAGQDPRWVAVLGLRGVGKTTMLSQLFQNIQADQHRKLFVALDDAKDNLGIGVREVAAAYERTLGKRFEELDEPVYLFFDEIHFDPQWALSLKVLVDRSPYIFIVMTGSSVSEINKQLDSATSRRVLAQTLHPMSFTEFRMLEEHKTFGRNNSGLGLKIRQLLYESESAEAVYDGLLALRSNVMDYWVDVAPNQRQAKIDKYMSYANLPFTLTYANNKEYIYQLIDQTLSIIINKDFRATYDFTNDTLRKIRLILPSIANSSTVSINGLAETYDIDRTILAKVVDALEKASVLQRIYPHAAVGKQSTKPSKYLFVSPAYRSMFFNYIGSVLPYDSYKGYLLEDTVGLYLSILTKQNVPSLTGLSVTYDDAENGADFVLTTDSRKICIEVGYGAKKPNQANATKLRHKCVYGLTVCSAPLKLSSNSLTVPLSYFLLTA